jgi:ABC-type transporter Mla MlaB component
LKGQLQPVTDTNGPWAQRDEASERDEDLAALVFDLSEMDIVDTTALGALIALIEEVEGHAIAVFITGVPPGLVHFLRIQSVKEKLGNVEMGKNIEEVADAVDAMDGADGSTEGGGELFGFAGQGSAARYQKSLAQAVDAALHEDERHRLRFCLLEMTKPSAFSACALRLCPALPFFSRVLSGYSRIRADFYYCIDQEALGRLGKARDGQVPQVCTVLSQP